MVYLIRCQHLPHATRVLFLVYYNKSKDTRVDTCTSNVGSVLQCVAVCCSVLQCVAVCCSVLQCVAVGGSVLQRVFEAKLQHV